MVFITIIESYILQSGFYTFIFLLILAYVFLIFFTISKHHLLCYCTALHDVFSHHSSTGVHEAHVINSKKSTTTSTVPVDKPHVLFFYVQVLADVFVTTVYCLVYFMYRNNLYHTTVFGTTASNTGVSTTSTTFTI